MGVVYKAEDTRLGRFVALKFLPDEVGRQLPVLDRFRREARAASALNHPNICTIYDIGQEERPRFHCHGIPGRLHVEAPDRAAILLSTATYCWISASRSPTPWTPRTASGIVHRDIKPANIFVTHARTGEGPGFRFGQR